MCKESKYTKFQDNKAKENRTLSLELSKKKTYSMSIIDMHDLFLRHEDKVGSIVLD